MIRYLLTASMLVAATCASLASDGQDGQPGRPDAEPVHYQSPRLELLARDLDASKSDALDRFWREVLDHTPVVESTDGDARYCWVTFLWHGNDKTRKVDLLGDVANPDMRKW